MGDAGSPESVNIALGDCARSSLRPRPASTRPSRRATRIDISSPSALALRGNGDASVRVRRPATDQARPSAAGYSPIATSTPSSRSTTSAVWPYTPQRPVSPDYRDSRIPTRVIACCPAERDPSRRDDRDEPPPRGVVSGGSHLALFTGCRRWPGDSGFSLRNGRRHRRTCGVALSAGRRRAWLARSFRREPTRPRTGGAGRPGSGRRSEGNIEPFRPR
jgi:hypothetical protein